MLPARQGQPILRTEKYPNCLAPQIILCLIRKKVCKIISKMLLPELIST